MFLVNALQCRHSSEKDCEIGSLYERLGATYKSLKITILGVFGVGKTTTLKMAKWLLHSYLQVAHPSLELCIPPVPHLRIS